MRTLVARLRQEGDGGSLHRLRGRASQRKIPEAVREKAVKLVQREYRDFGPTLATEYLAEQHGLGVSKETLRQWLIAAGVWKRKRRRVEEVHVWRARRACRRRCFPGLPSAAIHHRGNDGCKRRFVDELLSPAQ